MWPTRARVAGPWRPQSTPVCRYRCWRPHYLRASARAANPNSPIAPCRRCAWASGDIRKSRPPLPPRCSGVDLPHSDAFVFFCATGDLAYKQIFPALEALVRRGQLEAPIVGVGRSGWTREKLIEQARASIKEHGVYDEQAFTKLASLLGYVDGDYREVATFHRLRQALGEAHMPLHYLAIPPSVFATVIGGLAAANC